MIEVRFGVDVWFEVFVSDKVEGTRTIKSFDTRVEADSFRDHYAATHPGVEVYVDSWWTDEPGCSGFPVLS